MTHRIAYLCGEYPRATDTFIRREVAALRDAGIDVHTISVRRPPKREQGSEELEPERRRTHYLLPPSPWRLLADHATLFAATPARYLGTFIRALRVRAPGLLALLYQLFYFAEAGLVAAHMKRTGIRHIHNHAPDASGYVTYLATHLASATYSLTIHGFGILSEPRRWRLEDKINASAFTICVSHDARGQAMLWSNPSHWDRLHIVHCGVDPAFYTPREHHGPGRRLMWVGRLDRVKGLPILIDALDQLRRTHPDVHLDLIGDGPMRDQITANVRDRGLSSHVTFHGYRSQDELRYLHAQADVMVMSSLAEGIPVVLMEAMAAGLPVVAPRIAGIPELVEHGISGWLVPPGDADALADRISTLLVDPAMRTRFADAGRQRVAAEFNIQLEVTRLTHIMRARLAGDAAPIRPSVEIPPSEAAPSASPARPADPSPLPTAQGN